MSLGGERTSEASIILILLTYIFTFASSIYPIVYIFSFISTRSKLKAHRIDEAIRNSIIPLKLLLVLSILMLLWFNLEEP